MATLTIRNLPDDLVKRLKAVAERNGRSMEQEVRELLQQRYMKREDLLKKIRARWRKVAAPSPAELKKWIGEGRP